MLSDAELVKACGVNIMGWTEVIEPPLAEGQFGLNSFGLCVPTGASEDDWVIWNPLTDETDCAAVLDKMAADGWAYRLEKRNGFVPACTRMACFYRGPLGDEEGYVELSHDRKRAVVLAALRANGVEVGE